MANLSLRNNSSDPPDLLFRQAKPADVLRAAALIYSSGPRNIEYGFGNHKSTGLDFLQFAFVNGRGLFGYQNHTVAVSNGEVVGILAAYNLGRYIKLTAEHMAQVWRFFPVMQWGHRGLRSLHLKSLMPVPSQFMHYIAHFGVHPSRQGMGIGRCMLDHQRHIGISLGRKICALDVSVDNPRAQSMYENYGFCMVHENRFTGPTGAIPNTRRLYLKL